MKREFSVTLDGVAYKVSVNDGTVLVNGQPFTVGLEADSDRVVVNGTPYDVKLEHQAGRAVVGGIGYSLAVEGLEADGPRAARRAGPAAGQASEGAVTAIMPGKIIRLLLEEGQTVEEGQVVCILEAMKMENELKAPRAGVLKTLHVRPGQDVERGTVVAEIE